MNERRITFLGVGPQRTGSTWLYKALCQHSSISFPRGVKETFFFDERYEKGVDWYMWHFKHATGQQQLGEIAPTYFDVPEAIDRIAQHQPSCKIIINVRNPMERAYSVFRHFHASGLVPPDFDRSIQLRPRILESGRYHIHAPMWEERFGASQVLYLVQEDIHDDSKTVLKTLTEFLEIEPLTNNGLADGQRVNSATAPISPCLVRGLESVARVLRNLRLHGLVNLGKSFGLKRLYSGGAAPPLLNEAQLRFLEEYYVDDVTWLETRLARDFSMWRQATHKEQPNNAREQASLASEKPSG